MYDFDKTLCTRNMQEYSFIEKLGMKSSEFWAKSNGIAEREGMDQILAYMQTMLKEASYRDIPIRRDDFVELGKHLTLFPGVESWFKRFDVRSSDLGVNLEHYIISSGLKEIIEGSKIHEFFTAVFACEFMYDSNGVACWPKTAVNYTTKTQYLFRINKGVLDINNDKSVNMYTPPEQRRIPFRNMIYIGDGMTDVPCMKLVKANGGASIAVFQGKENDTVENLLVDNRVNYIAEADYREDSELDKVVFNEMCKMAMADHLAKASYEQRKRAEENIKKRIYTEKHSAL